MAKTKISEFSTTPGNNTDINGINIAEGCAPSGINNAIRELMSDLKEWQSGAMDVYVIPQGTAAAPGIQLYGDLDTGLYGYAANQLGVAVGGASAGYFSSAGWVGNVVATTVDLTNIEVTNIKAKDGTTSISLADSTGIATFSKATVIETTDNTNAALRITQLGTGNALLVEDATSPDATPTVIDQFGNVILGKDTRTSVVTGKAEIHSTSSENLGLTPSLGFYNWSATASSASHLTFRHYPSGTVGTLAANTSGDVLGRVVFLSYDGTNAFSASIIGVSGTGGSSPSISYAAAGGHNFSSGVVSVSTQLNADNLRLDGNTISSTDTDGNIVISPNGTGDVQIDADTVRVGDSNANVTITTNGTGDLTLNTNSGTSSGYIQILDGANGNIGIVPDGTGIVYLSSSTVVTGNANPSTKITTLGTSDLTLDTNEGFESGSILIENGVNGDIIITPDGTGKTQISGTLDVTTIEATNIRAKDGTASIVLTDVSGAVDISKAVTFSTTTETIALGTSQTTGMFTVGGTAQTGTQTFDRSTKTHTLNLGTGATESGLTKTINIGTAGVSGSTTAINIGSANGTTTTLNGTVTAATFNSTTIDTTNLEVTNIKAKDGTAALSIADSTGVVSVSANPVLSGGTANGVVYLDGSKVATSGTALTFDGTTFKNKSASPYLRAENVGGTVASYVAIDGFYTVGSDLYTYAEATYNHRFFTGGTEKMRLLSGGQLNLGGNFTSTNNTLQVTGNAAIGYTTAAPTTGLIVAGNVGFGTSSPSTSLTINKAVGSFIVGRTADSNASVLQFGFDPTSGESYIESTRSGTGTNLNLAFWTGGSRRATIDTSGNVGIGTNSPTRRFVVEGTDPSTNSRYVVAQLARATSGTAAAGIGGSLQLLAEDDAGTQREAALISWDLSNVSAAAPQGRLYLGTRGSNDAVVIDNSGNLGLGVTPSAWGGPFKAIDVNSGGSYTGTSATARVFGNAYYNGSNYIYRTSTYANYYYCGDGQHAWYNAPSGTAGNAISFTQAMTLDASGNLLVGKTTTYGDEIAAFYESANASRYLYVENPNSGTSTAAIINANTGAGGDLRMAAYGTNHSTQANNASLFNHKLTGSLLLGTEGTERARITSGGVFILGSGEGTATVSGNTFRAPSAVGTNIAGASLTIASGNGTGTGGSGIIAFQTAAAGSSGTTANTMTERARITSGGYFKASNNGVYYGTAGSQHELRNAADGEWVLRAVSASATDPNGIEIRYSAGTPNGTTNRFLYCLDSTAVRAEIRSNGGLANYQSNNVDLSDIRTKTDVNPVASYWNKIAALEIVTYKYKDQTHDDLNIGVIAQQVEQVAPEFVDPDGFGETPEDGVPLKTIYNKDLTFAAIKALQEAMARIEKLEAEVAALKGA